MTEAPPTTGLDIERLQRNAEAGRLGHAIHYFNETDSTNTRAAALARDGAPDGTVVVAEAQSKGRGRLGRTWVSPARRNLYVSILFRSPAAARPEFALVLGIAVAHTIREWVPGAQLKWPNDVLINGRKVGGILTEVERMDDEHVAVIAGIGVNLNLRSSELPTELQSKAGSVAEACGAWIDRTDFLQRLLHHVGLLWEEYRRTGFAALRREWEVLANWTGQTVEIDDGRARIRGTVLGLDDDGALLVRREDGSTARVLVGDVTVVDGYAARH